MSGPDRAPLRSQKTGIEVGVELVDRQAEGVQDQESRLVAGVARSMAKNELRRRKPADGGPEPIPHRHELVQCLIAERSIVASFEHQFSDRKSCCRLAEGARGAASKISPRSRAINIEARSARAVIVSSGLTPSERGITAPSITYRPS